MLTSSDIRKTILEEIRLIDPNLRHKRMYAEDMLKNLKFMKNEEILVSNLFDPRTILISQGLDDSCIFECTAGLSGLIP